MAVGIYCITKYERHQKGVKAVDIDGQQATVKNPKYPVSRPLYLLTHGEPSSKIKNFLDWTLSQQGQKVLTKKFVGIK